MDKYTLEREYLLVESEYNKAKTAAVGFRNEYKRKCDECIGFVVIAVLMVMFYYFSIVYTGEHGAPILAPIIIVMRLVYWAIGAIYGLFLLRKVYSVYIEGYSTIARKLAKKMRRTPLTVKAEECDEKAAKYANRLSELQELILKEDVFLGNN